MRLAIWVLTVLMLMWRSSAISLLVQPRATGIKTSSSRLVIGSIGCAGFGRTLALAKVARSLAVMLGAFSASPAPAAWVAGAGSAGPGDPRCSRRRCTDRPEHHREASRHL